MDVQALQTALGHEFMAKDLLQQALTHRSHSTAHNERLEFLGDSVLNCVVASLLFDKFARIDEGDLSRLRANLVKQQSLYEIAQRLELSPYLRLGEGELKSGGFRRPSILADTVEALFGAVFLDAGFETARGVIRKQYLPVLETVDPKTLGKDSKTLLQEYLQGRKIALPIYTVVATHGAAHSQEFEVECAVPKLAIQVLGGGGSRRAAEQAAAKKALEVAQTLAVAATKKARRAKPAQLTLEVAVEQSADPTRESRRADGPAGDGEAATRPGVDRPLVKATTVEPARIVAERSTRPSAADGSGSRQDGRLGERRDAKPDLRAAARPEHPLNGTGDDASTEPDEPAADDELESGQPTGDPVADITESPGDLPRLPDARVA